MSKFWDIVQPTVWAACENAHCEWCDPPEYGPRMALARDQSVHFWKRHELVQPGFLVVVCTCGWRDLSMNWEAHLDEVAPSVPVYS